MRDWRYCVMRMGDSAYRVVRVLHRVHFTPDIPHVTHPPQEHNIGDYSIEKNWGLGVKEVGTDFTPSSTFLFFISFSKRKCSEKLSAEGS